MADIQEGEEVVLSSFAKEVASNSEPEDLGNFENILAQLIEKIDKPSIKNSLKDKLIINRITSDTVEFITISKVAQLMFNNKEHMRYMEDKLSEVMGQTMAIQVVFENKESYFARKLGLEN